MLVPEPDSDPHPDLHCPKMLDPDSHGNQCGSATLVFSFDQNGFSFTKWSADPSIATKCKAKLYFFSRKFIFMVKNIRNYYTIDAGILTPFVKLGIGSGSASNWKVVSGSVFRRCRSTTLVYH
jgi:hypothetical protein